VISFWWQEIAVSRQNLLDNPTSSRASLFRGGFLRYAIDGLEDSDTRSTTRAWALRGATGCGQVTHRSLAI
jgi:hypothetical protein